MSLVDLANSLAEAAILVDEHQRIVVFNAAASALFECPSKQAFGRNLGEFLHPCEGEESAPSGGPSSEDSRSVAAPTTLHRFTGMLPGGREIALEVSRSELGSEAQRRSMFILRDASGPRGLERDIWREHDLARRLADTAQDIVLILDASGRIVDYNRFMRELCGYDLEEVRGRNWFDTFIPKDDQDQVLGVFSSAIAGRQTRGNENPILLKNGSRRIIRWWDTELRDEHGELEGLLCVGQDITDQLESERRARDAEQRASVSLLAAGVAHDIGTPLTSVSGYAEMIRESATDPENRTRAQVICEQVQRVSHLVRTLMHLAAPRQDEQAPVDIEALTLSSLDFFREKFRVHEIEVKRDFSRVGSILGSPDRLQQVLLNLLANAADAMPNGGCLCVRLSLHDDDTVEIGIRDTGVGMPPDVSRRIFEPFFTTKQRGQGFGLGLMAARGIVIDHGGTIAVASQQGVGTEFRVRLPRRSPKRRDD